MEAKSLLQKFIGFFVYVCLIWCICRIINVVVYIVGHIVNAIHSKMLERKFRRLVRLQLALESSVKENNG